LPLVERDVRWVRRVVGLLVAGAVLLPSACSRTPETGASALEDDAISVASVNFRVSGVLAEL
jgi:hypothetical protein